MAVITNGRKDLIIYSLKNPDQTNRVKNILNKTKKNRIINSLSSLLVSRSYISTAYLFGSFLRNESFSDIDIGILTYRGISNPLEFEMNLEIVIEKVIQHNVDIRLLNNAPIPFIQNVIRNGQVICDKDPNFRADFESNVLRKYFDFSIFRQRYLSETINAPV